MALHPYIRSQERLEEIETKTLSPCGQLSAWATRRIEIDAEGRQYELRTAYQRDRDRIIHSRAFRRLKHKTQVFIPYKNDHQRTRLTHTIEVMQLSRTIARCLGLNEDLTEAIAFAHDVGHTPFGHVGERTLVQIMNGRMLGDVIPGELIKDSGGFKHNAQSVRVVELLESRYAHRGLNLTDQTREGILKHTGWQRWRDYPGVDPAGLHLDREQPHFEGQVLAIADEIAQQTHDLEDGIRGGIIKFSEVAKLDIIKFLETKIDTLRDKKISGFTRQNAAIRGLIHTLVVNVIDNSAKRLEEWYTEHKIKNHNDFRDKQESIDLRVDFGDDIKDMFDDLRTFVLENVIRSRTVQLNDESGEYFTRELFRLYYEDPTMLPWYILEEYRELKQIKHLHELARFRSKEEVDEEIAAHYSSEPDFVRAICDYIAGMSNTYAIKEYERWVMPFHG